MKNRLPDALRAGDTWSWAAYFDAHPASDGWALGYTLLNSLTRHTATAVADGDGFIATVTAAESATYAPGNYSWVARVVKGAEVHTVATGTVRVLPDLTNATDLRSHAQKTLDAIEAVIEKRASRDQQAYSINGRSLTRMTLAELIRLRDMYRREVQRDAGDSRGRRLLVRL